jgi:hypothetical protein
VQYKQLINSTWHTQIRDLAKIGRIAHSNRDKLMNKYGCTTSWMLLFRHEKKPQQQGFSGFVDAVADWFVDALQHYLIVPMLATRNRRLPRQSRQSSRLDSYLNLFFQLESWLHPYLLYTL